MTDRMTATELKRRQAILQRSFDKMTVEWSAKALAMMPVKLKKVLSHDPG